MNLGWQLERPKVLLVGMSSIVYLEGTIFRNGAGGRYNGYHSALSLLIKAEPTNARIQLCKASGEAEMKAQVSGLSVGKLAVKAI